MLAEACPVCYNPLFEYNGKSQCVVCEEKSRQDAAKTDVIDNKESDDTSNNYANTLNQDVLDAARDALVHVLFCITQVKDAHSIKELSDAAQVISDVYLKLRQR